MIFQIWICQLSAVVSLFTCDRNKIKWRLAVRCLLLVAWGRGRWGNTRVPQEDWAAEAGAREVPSAEGREAQVGSTGEAAGVAEEGCGYSGWRW